MLGYCRADVVDGGPTLTQHGFNVCVYGWTSSCYQYVGDLYVYVGIRTQATCYDYIDGYINTDSILCTLLSAEYYNIGPTYYSGSCSMHNTDGQIHI